METPELASLSACLAFLISATPPGNAFSECPRVLGLFKAIDRAVAEKGWKMLLVLRLTPVSRLHWATTSTLTLLSFKSYALTTLAAAILGALFYAFLGDLGVARRPPAGITLLVLGALAVLAYARNSLRSSKIIMGIGPKLRTAVTRPGARLRPFPLSCVHAASFHVRPRVVGGG